MTETKITMKKMALAIALTWVLCLVTTIILIYFAPRIFPPISSEEIADGAIVTAKLADGSVTARALASDTIPSASSWSLIADSTDSHVSWIDMNDMTCTITLQRTSLLLIMFSTEAKSDSGNQILVRALVGTDVAAPYEVYLTPAISYGGEHAHDENSAGYHSHDESRELAWPANHEHAIYGNGEHTHSINQAGSHTHELGYMAYSYHFFKSSVQAGTYTVKIQWQVTGGIGYVIRRTLVVSALPMP